uniref:Calcium voltage-gated channel subunit alpha1 I n=1 Tax=Ictidomys tridecemlineatus TaxID=43179 RepID=I3N0U5_ICTTR
MAESTPPASSSAAAPAPELGITAQPGPQSPPPSPPGLEEPLDGADPEVPHPDLAPVAFFCLRQTTSPRNWCIKMVCNPYPLLRVILDRCPGAAVVPPSSPLGPELNSAWVCGSLMVEYSLDLQNINLSAIRTVRVLRPLKAINRVPSMRILVNLLLDTLPMLGNVLLLCFFVFFIFGIIGVQLWAGLLRNRCFLEENFTLSRCPQAGCGRRGQSREACSHEEQEHGAGNSEGCPTRAACARPGAHQALPSRPRCRLQVITLEGWVEIMYYVMDAHSFYNFIYFILLIIVGSFFMINLCLVVIATQFSETKQREHRLMLEQRQRYLSSSTVASYAEPGDCYEEIFQYVCHILRKAKRRTLGLYQALQSRRQALGPGAPAPARPGPHAWGGHRHCLLCPRHSALDPTPHTLVQPISAMLASDPTSCPHCQHGAGRRSSGPGSTDSGQEGSGSGGSSGSEAEADGDGPRSSEDGGSSGLGKEDEEGQVGAVRLCGDVWRETRAKLRGIVDSKYFNRGIMMAILVNTVSMGIEHHEQPEELTNILEICNVVFTSMFALEMILKLAAFGLFDYLRNPYNIFDSIIVIISIWEIVGQADGGLSVLRTFRLLRVLKLVRFMPALRRQLVVLMKTMDNVATFCMLLMLFIFIFSILGMHIFGCKFSLRTDTGDTVPDRKNFDSLLWAIVTVFQILTQEDWNVVLYNGMASTSPWASLYFVALMTFGNYVLFNLLVAILVEGFQAEGDANRSYSDEDQSSSNMEEYDKFQEALDSSGDPKLCPIPLTPNGHLDPSLPLGGHLGPTGAVGPASRLSLQPDPMLVALDSRKSSVMSLGRMSYDQRSLSSTRSSYYGPWGRSGAWASRRSSWNSLKHKPPSAEHESLLSAERSGARACEGAREEGPPRAAPLHAPHAHHVHHGPHLAHRHRHHRRTLSLDTRDSVDLTELLPAMGLHPRAAWRAAGMAPGHEDCNGRMPNIAKDVFTKMDDGRDRGEDEEEIDYPDWCEVREDWSVYLFSPENRFRVLCQTIIAHKLFDYVVLAFIFLNCITIALERPQIEAGSTERIFLTVSNYIFTAIFVGEMTLKVALGFTFTPSSGTPAPPADCHWPVTSAGGAKILGVLRVLRLLRTLRPLRVISRAPGLKLVVETLISSLKPIGNIVLICCAFFIIFGILGVQLFKGKFYHCLGVDTRNITNRSDCVAANYRWVHHKYNFDNLGQALMSLFVLASKDGWVNIMYNGLDAVAVDQQPVTNHNPWMLLYFISFLLIVSFFVLNMFVGVVVENFHKCRQHQEAEEARRREEKRLRRLEKKRRSEWAARGPGCVLSPSQAPVTPSLETALKYCNYMFTTVFVLEAVLKLVAFGLRRFFKDRWNQLDLAIVLLSVMGITLEEIEINAALPINPTIIRIMRVLRIARVLKLLKMATGMRALLDTVVQALPQVGNLGLLFMLLFFIYAALGVELFGKLVCNEENPCEGMSRHATFENFGMAFLTLFQVSTGDNWNGIMKDTLRDCTQEEHSCLSSLQFVSPLYFVSFVLTAQFVLINVVVAVLMKHLDDSNKEAQEDAEMDAEIELEMAHGLGPSPRPPPSSPGALGRGPGGAGGGGDAEGRLCRRCYSPAQENLWLDSVSLIIKDSLEGELTIIDNLSGSIFHHYASPAGCEKCHHDQQEVQLAETEAFSLNSDKSSSILLGDDLSLEDPAACPPGPKDSKGPLHPPTRVGDLGECFFPLSNMAMSTGAENFLCEMEAIPFNPVRSWLKHESSQGEGWGPQPPHPTPPSLILGICFRPRWLSFSLVFLPRLLYLFQKEPDGYLTMR